MLRDIALGVSSVKDNTRIEVMRDLRTQGLTYEEIGREMGITRQRVYQLIGSFTNHQVIIRPEQCVYPELRFWMLEENISINGLARLAFGRLQPEERARLAAALKGANCSKGMIDKILKATGLTYEVAFERGAESES